MRRIGHWPNIRAEWMWSCISCDAGTPSFLSHSQTPWLDMQKGRMLQGAFFAPGAQMKLVHGLKCRLMHKDEHSVRKGSVSLGVLLGTAEKGQCGRWNQFCPEQIKGGRRRKGFCGNCMTNLLQLVSYKETNHTLKSLWWKARFSATSFTLLPQPPVKVSTVLF